MRLGFCLYLMIALTLSAIIFPRAVNAQDSTGYKETFGFKIGYYGGGNININTREYETDPGLCFGGNFDIQVSRKFYFGIALDFAQFKMWGESEYIVNGSLIMKHEIPIKHRTLLLRPAVGIGLAMMQEVYWMDNTYYVTLQFFNEFVTIINGKTNLLWDIGLLWELSGGNDIDVITGGPFLLIRFGLSI